MSRVYVTGAFDALGSRELRFLQEASRAGEVHAFIWSDALAYARTGLKPTFPLAERLYMARALRWVTAVTVVTDSALDDLPAEATAPGTWVVHEGEDSPSRRSAARTRGVEFNVVAEGELEGFPGVTDPVLPRPSASVRRVVVTGSFDWMHSGHVRFFEEASGLGRLFVVVGSDRNIRLLKGEGHPLFPEKERRYCVDSLRTVSGTFISTGTGWMDAAPEIARIHPDLYAVNEDGDRPEKRDFCREQGIEYVVLSRIPREGLPRRSSTDLRGF